MAASRSRRSSCGPGSPPRSCSTELAVARRARRLRAARPRRRDRGARVGVGAALARPATGRVRILSPYRARAARARALFCAALQDGEFPSAAPARPAALRGAPPRRSATRTCAATDQADEERYLFHSCVSRPTERLFLSWQSCDEDGAALARSPFVDEVLDLLDAGATSGEDGLVRMRGPERAVPTRAEATSERALARALALAGWAFERRAGARGGSASPSTRARSLALFAGLPNPDHLPGPLSSAVVLAELGAREVFSANSLEGWVDLLVQVVRRARAPPAAARARRPTRCGSAASSTTRSSGSTASPRERTRSRGRATSAAGAPLRRAARRAAAKRGRAAQPRPAHGARARPGPGRRLSRRRGRDRDRVPPARATCSSSASAPLRRGRPTTAPAHAALRARRRRRCAGGSTASTSPPTGAARSSATTRPARRSPAPTSSASAGTLQIQLYMLRRRAGARPRPGRRPLPPARRHRAERAQAARARRARATTRLDGLDLVGTDRKPAEELRGAARRAPRRSPIERRARRCAPGDIRRDPLNGECPKLLHLPGDLPARARARRVGEEANGG